MAFFAVSTCCPSTPITNQRAPELFTKAEKLALITDVMLAALVAAVAVTAILSQMHGFDLGPLNAISTLTPQTIQHMLYGLAGFAAFETLLILIKQATHINKLAEAIEQKVSEHDTTSTVNTNLEGKLLKARQELEAAQATATRLQGELVAAKAAAPQPAQAGNDAEIAQLKVDLKAALDNAADLQKQLDAAKAAPAAQPAQDDNAGEIAMIKDDLKAALDNAADLQKQLDAAKAAPAAQPAQAGNDAEITQLKVDLKAAQERADDLQKQLDAAKAAAAQPAQGSNDAEVTRLTAVLQATQDQVAQLTKEKTELEEAAHFLVTAKETHEKQAQRINDLEGKLKTTNDEVTQLKAEIAKLTDELAEAKKEITQNNVMKAVLKMGVMADANAGAATAADAASTAVPSSSPDVLDNISYANGSDAQAPVTSLTGTAATPQPIKLGDNVLYKWTALDGSEYDLMRLVIPTDPGTQKRISEILNKESVAFNAAPNELKDQIKIKNIKAEETAKLLMGRLTQLVKVKRNPPPVASWFTA